MTKARLNYFLEYKGGLLAKTSLNKILSTDSPRKCAIFCGNDADLEKYQFLKRAKENPETLIYQRFQDLFVAGAEGLEPSARGFGVHLEV